MFSDFDIAILGGGVAFRAIRRPFTPVDVTDGFLTIKFRDNVPLLDYPKISAIEVFQADSAPVAVATKAPVTKAPVSRAPVTKAPVTKAPVTKAPVTKAPVTKSPVTQAPVAKAPVTVPVIKAPVQSPKAPSAPVMAPKAPIIAPKAPAAAPLALAPVVAPTGLAPVLINCGGADYVDSFGRTWMSDRYFTAGFPYANPAAAIADTVDDTLYSCERYGHSTYNIPLPPGKNLK
jgi:Malectin domain